MIGEPWPLPADAALDERGTCPVGHQVRDPWALRCPTCGRLMPRRFARTCPNGHVVAGPTRVCPACGAVIDRRRTIYVMAGVAVGVFAVLALFAWSADVPARLIAFFEEAYAFARDWLLTLPLFRP